MNAPSQDIKDMLVSSAAGLDVTFATDLFVSTMPESPDQCVAIYDSPGFPPEPNYEYYYPGVQIRVRGDQGGYRAAWTLAESIRDVLKAVHDETWNSTKYVQIWCSGEIYSLGQDENNRPLFSMNFSIQRTII
jgi:hypothetical protein